MTAKALGWAAGTLIVFGGMPATGWSQVSPATALPDLAGFWRADLEHRGTPGRFAVEFVRRDGELSVVLSFPDLDAPDAVSLEADEVEGGVRIAGTWDLTWTEDGALEGTVPDWLAPAHEIPLRLTRGPRPDATPETAVDGLPVPAPIWEVDLGGAVWGGVAAGGGSLLVGNTRGVVHALDPQTGAHRWMTDVGSPVRARPVVAGEEVFVRTDDGRLHGLALESGRLVRSIEVSAPVDREADSRPSQGPVHHSAPVVASGADLFVAAESGELFRVDRESGEIVWRVPTGGPITGAPAVDGERVFVAGFDGLVRAVRRSDGEIVWTHPTGAAVPSGPVLDGGVLFVAGRNWELLALDPLTGEPRWSELFWFSWVEGAPVVAGEQVLASTSDAQSLFALDRSDGTRRWRFDAGGSVWSAPAVSGRLAVVPAVGVRPYFIEHRGSVHLVDLDDGRPLWRFPARDDGAGLWGFVGQPLLLDGVAYAVDLAGTLFALPADPVDLHRFDPVEAVRVPVDGADLFVQRLGGGPPVVVLHGFAAEWRPEQWRHLLDELDGRTVIGVDLRGHGRSARPHVPSAYGVRMIDDVLAVLDALGVERADLVGYSLGGLVALEAARLHPDRIRSAVLIGQGWADPGELAAMAAGAGSLATLDTLSLAPRDRESARRNDAAALAALVSSYPQLAVPAESIPAIEPPILAVVGEFDPRLARAVALRDARPSTRLRVLPDRDHGSVVDDPAYARAIAAFLDEVSPTGTTGVGTPLPHERAAERALLDAMYGFLDAMRRKDADGMRRALVPSSRFTLLREQDGTPAPWVLTGEEFVEALTAPDAVALEERLGPPRVRLEGPLATVWADYQVFADGGLSHCGTDAFQFALLDGVWKLLALADTPPRTECGAPFAPGPGGRTPGRFDGSHRPPSPP